MLVGDKMLSFAEDVKICEYILTRSERNLKREGLVAVQRNLREEEERLRRAERKKAAIKRDTLTGGWTADWGKPRKGHSKLY